MKKEAIKASTGTKEKGDWKEFTGTCDLYENVGELVAALKDPAKGPSLVSVINAQIKTNATNALRKPEGGGTASVLKKALSAFKPEKQAELLKQIQALMAAEAAKK